MPGFKGKTCEVIEHGKVMVTTGFPYSSGVHTEIVDLNDPDFSCPDLPDFPQKIKDGGGGLLREDLALICGGWNGTSVGDCYCLGTDKQWVLHDTGLQEPRFHGGYGNVVIDEKLWKSGGLNSNSSELVGGLKSVSSTDLPQAMYAHCSIKINDSVILVTGGKSRNPGNQTYFHNFKTGFWSDGPELNQSRFQHGCKSFYIGNDLILVVAGGFGTKGMLKSVEFLNVNKLEEGWITPKNTELPIAMAEFSLVMSLNKKSIFAIGGDDGSARDDILELNCDKSDFESCSWKTSPSKLKYAREDHVALLIPDSFVNELCKN